MEISLSVIMTKMLSLLSDKRRTMREREGFHISGLFVMIESCNSVLEFYLNFVDDPVENLKIKSVVSISDILNNLD